MNLNIDKFVTRCQVPKRLVATWQGVDRVVRERFPIECHREVSAHLPEPSRVIRIRRLLIRLQLSGQFDGERLARAWSEAFARALLAAINSPGDSENGVVQARTRAEWLARFISDVISGSAAARWEYEEFKEALRLGTADCVLTVLSREPWEIVSVLLLLDDRKRFDPFLWLFDDFRLEKLFSLLASVNDEETNEPTVDDLLTIGALVISQSNTRGRLATRQRALRIFLALSRTRKVDRDRVLPPRLVLHALMTFDALVELTQSLPPESWFQVLAPESLARRQHPSLHPVVLDVIAKVWALATQMDPGVHSQKLDLLSQLLFELSPVPVIKSTSGEKGAHWVSSECAGLLLLAGLIERLGWVQRIRISSLGSRLESRALNYCLAALAVRLLGQSPESERLDPGLLLFAGWPEPASVDLTGFCNFLVSLSETEQNDLLDLLTDTEENHKGRFGDWRATFDCLAGVLTREFSSRVRGFRKANAAFVIKTFFSQPGRIFIDDKRILVILQANPFHIALHISSMDESVESVSWLGGRRLEFQLEGL
jgi:hypothetical protein